VGINKNEKLKTKNEKWKKPYQNVQTFFVFRFTFYVLLMGGKYGRN